MIELYHYHYDDDYNFTNHNCNDYNHNHHLIIIECCNYIPKRDSRWATRSWATHNPQPIIPELRHQHKSGLIIRLI